MANPVIVNIPGIGAVEATNAATEQTLNEILKAIKGSGAARGKAGGATGVGAAGGLGGGLGGMGKQVASVAKGMGGLAGKLGVAANAAGQVAMKFLEVGAASAHLIKNLSNVGDDLESAAGALSSIPIIGQALESTFGAVAQASQKAARAFQEAAGAGATFGGSMNNFVKTASQAGMTMEQFGALVKNNGSGMLGFGATVEEGAKRFGQVSKALRASGSELYALGYSTQDINEGLAKYGNLMRLTGRSQNMSAQDMARGAKSYLVELDKMAKITGEDRKAKESQMEQLAKDGQYQAKLAMQSETVRKSFDSLMMNTPADLQGFVKDFITTGTATTEESARLASLYGADVMKELQGFHQKLNRHEALTVEEQNRLNNLLADGSKRIIKTQGDTLAASREMDTTTRAVVSGLKLQKDSVIKADKENKAAANSQEKLNKQIEEAKAKLAAMSNSFTMVLVNSGLLDNLMSAFGALAGFVNTVVVPVFKAFSFAMDVLMAPFSLVADLVGFFYKGLLKVADTIEDFLSPVFSFFGRIIGDVGTTIKTYFQPIIKETASWFSSTFKAMMGLLAPVINVVVKAFTTAKTIVSDFFNSFNTLGEVVTSIKLAFRTLGLNLKEMWFAIKDYIPGLKDVTPKERDQLNAEKAALADEKRGHQAKLEQNRLANQKKEEENQKARDRAREDRDKKFYEDKAARDKAAEEKKGVDYSDSLSLLKRELGKTAKPPGGSIGPPPPGGAVGGAAGLGGLSSKFEAGSRGSSAVGWDSTGGTSYGKYQIASKTGTMSRFMEFLKTNNPEAYARLSKAGPADAGKDGAFAKEWQALAASGKLGTSEHDFIKKTHFDVGMSGLKNKNLKGMIGNSKALQEVMWSTSVQHGGGGASGIFDKVYKEGMSEQDLIKAIYAERGTKFGKSSAGVQQSVQKRFAEEQQLAMGMIGQPGSSALPSSQELANAVALGQNTGKQTAASAQAAAAAQEENKKRQGSTGTAGSRPPTTQESAETLLASLNSKMDQLIRLNHNIGRLNERQLTVQQGLTNDLFVGV